MRVLLIHQAFVSPEEPGGTRHYEFARICAERGIHFTVVTSRESYLSGKRVRDSDFEQSQVDPGPRVLRTYALPTLHRGFVWRVLSFISFTIASFYTGWRAGPVDVVMGTSPPVFQALTAWLLAAIRRVPFLLEIRDLWPEFAIDMGVLRRPILIILARRLESFLYARATHLLVNSPAYRDYLIEKGVPERKISFVSNGVDISSFDAGADGSACRQKWAPQDQFVVMYAGALGMANDIPTLLRAAEKLKTIDAIRFVLIGDGKERRHLEEMREQKDLNNVMFVGTLPKSEMPTALAASDVCVAILQDIPMFRTTYPNKVFDYMAAGKPSVLAIDGVIREVIEAAEGGLYVPPGDSEGIANAILTLYQSPTQCRIMGARARKYVEIHYERQKLALEFIDVLQSVSEE